MDAAAYREGEKWSHCECSCCDCHKADKHGLTSHNPSLSSPFLMVPVMSYPLTGEHSCLPASILLPWCELHVQHVMDAVPGSWLPEVSVQIVTV